MTMEGLSLLLWIMVAMTTDVGFAQETDMFDFSNIDEPMDGFGSTPVKSRIDKCRSNRHVCSTILRYPGNQTFSDGVHCLCPGCTEEWGENDNQSFTWVHYERHEQLVQYRFCIPVMPERTCDKDDLAVVMETETSNWRVYMAMARCKCPNNVFQLSNWWKRNKVWMYEYGCQKKSCEKNNSLCSKIYIDKVHDSALGYEFQCACPTGYNCPSDREPEMESLVDHIGHYVPMYCRPARNSGQV
ncbi:uncharacterized protein LOC132564426 [Ylistrum balloti]|uniref:uncharacterized protein LOC132564426 n=1 Tax=Ylistrum balloti TaxID=509963 RepID=UPI002905BF23|nr:uncharacterized protein LOC132564426 [Ylistrum balloti]